MKAKIQDNKILLRLSNTLLDSLDQVIKGKVPGLNRSEFVRRAVRFTIDNIDQFQSSEALTVQESLSPESVEKINAVREQFDKLNQYADRMQKEPGNNISVKQLAFLVKLVGEMVFKMNDPA